MIFRYAALNPGKEIIGAIARYSCNVTVSTALVIVRYELRLLIQSANS